MRKYFNWLTILLMSLGVLMGSASTLAVSAEAATIEDGVYETEVEGHNGPMVIETTIEDGKLADVQVKDHSESEGISDPAIDQIPAAIVEANSINVDAVAGATVTSNAIRDAVSDAITQAGGEVSDFFQETEDSEAGETIEYSTEVVVVGSGIAGLATAIEAKDNGADVLVLEKQGLVGGSTILSGGEILAAESPIQEALGNESSWEDLANYFYEISNEVGDKEFYDYIAQNSGEGIQFLADNGVDFADDVVKLHSSHEHAWGHYPKERNGASFVNPLVESLEERGVEILMTTEAHTLIEKDGRIIGVEAIDSAGNTVVVKAEHVVLATGGYNQNEAMLKEYHPTLDVYTINGGSGNTGDGIQMAKAVGAQTLFHDAGIDLATNIPTYYGYGEEFKGLLVSEEGQRYMDESEFHFVRSSNMLDMGETITYAITTESTDLVEQSVEEGNAYKASSLEDLAQAIAENQAEGEKKFDEAAFLTTVERYNELAGKGQDDDFNKDADFLTPIEGETYYALKLTTSNSGTHGGLVVTLNGEVLDENNEAIPGLYAVGEVANGQYMIEDYPGSGTAIISFLTLARGLAQYITQ